MARIMYANNASDTLNGAINDSTTTITLNDASEFYAPTGDEISYATIDDGTNIEIITYTGVSTNDLTGVTRGVDGTSGTAFDDAVTIEQRAVAAVLNTYAQGPGSSTDNAVARYDSTTGKLLQDSGVTIDDSDNIDGVASLDIDASGSLSFNSTDILADSAGTMTLYNIDAIDATTEATLKADFLANDGDIGTGVYDFGGASSFEIPNGAAPTVDAAGEIAIDTTIADYTGLIKYHDGTEELTVVGMPTANLSTTDGHVVKYNASNNEFEMGEAGAGSGGLVLLGSATASSSSELLFESLIDSTYQVYLFTCENIRPSTDGVAFYAQTSSNNGTSYDSTSGDYYDARVFVLSSSSSVSGQVSETRTELPLLGSMGTGTGEGAQMTLYMFNTDGNTYTAFIEAGAPYRSDNDLAFNNSSMLRTSTTAVNAVRFYMSSGNIASGTIRLYGVKKS